MEEESSNESVYFSANGGFVSYNWDDGESGPVSSRTQTFYGGLVVVVNMAAFLAMVGTSAALTPSSCHTRVSFAKSATMWSVHGFLIIKFCMDIGLFDHYCQQMEARAGSR